jgi:D-alanyl-D-alanine carboxypeptidase (penicillin-binding protein 5/6)
LRSGLAALVILLLSVSAVQARAPDPPPEVDAIPVSILTDLGSGQVLFARAPDRSFVPASMTKVMTAYVAFEEMAKGRLAADRTFVVPDDIASEWKGKGTSLYLSGGDVVTTDTLLHGIATVSANDASIVLAQGYTGSVAAWSFLMNDEARRLGMTHSRYNTPNGWPDEGKTYVSASDLVKLARAMIERHPKLYRTYFGQKTFAWGGRAQQSHDPTVGVVPGADGIKTGYTREAGYNFLGSAVRDGRRIVLVVAGAKSSQQRADASRALMEWAFTGWARKDLFAKGEIVGSARVQGGDARTVPLVAATPTYAAIPPGTDAGIGITVRYEGPLIAPVAKGARVATMEIRVDGMPPGQVPLYAARSVSTAGPLDRLLNGIYGLFS